MRHVYRVTTGEVEMVSAQSQVEAVLDLAEALGLQSFDDLREYYGNAVVELVPDEELLTVLNEDCEEGDEPEETHSCGVWAAMRSGFLSMTERE